MDPLLPDDPRSVGGYVLSARLGGGGMGQVFLGRSPGGRPVAVKLVRPEYGADAEFRRRFAVEVEAARRVGGFYTAQVVDADPQADPPWLVTAYVPGPSLQTAVAEYGRLSVTAVRMLSAGLAEGLAAIHGCGLVHRDLKPGNVILATDGPRVIDFGIARALEATIATATGVIAGTPAYMSPEQARGDREIGPASDVFSLGSVLAFAATGTSPFGHGHPTAVLYRIVREDPDLAAVPHELRDLLAACLAKDPAARPSVAEVLDLCAGAGAAEGWLPPPINAMIAAAGIGSPTAEQPPEQSQPSPHVGADTAAEGPAPRPGNPSALAPTAAVSVAQLAESVVLWQGQVPGSARVWVRLDGLLVIDNDLFDVPTGTRLAAKASAFPPTERSATLGRPQVASGWPSSTALGGPAWNQVYPCVRLWNDLLVIGRRRGRGGKGLEVAGVDPLTGQTMWRRKVPAGFDRDMWWLWFSQDDRDGAMDFGTFMPHVDLAVPDPDTGRFRWRTPWRPILDPRASFPPQPRWAADDDADTLLVAFVDFPRFKFQYTLALFDQADGAVLWRAISPAETLIGQFAVGRRHVVASLYPQAEYEHRSPDGNGPTPTNPCTCQAPTPGNRLDQCASCSGYRPWLALEVRDRANGELAWSHRWPWEDWHDPKLNALMVRDQVVITLEHTTLHGRRLDDGQLLWTAEVPVPPSPIPAVSTSEEGEYAHDLARTRSVTVSTAHWAWLAQLDLTSSAQRIGITDHFVHAATGHTLTLPGAFHHTDDDLVLTRTNDTVACTALPGSRHQPRPDHDPGTWAITSATGPTRPHRSILGRVRSYL